MKSKSDMYADSTYLENNPSWHEEDSPWKADKIHEFIKNCGIHPKTVCEVGCGAGGVLLELSKLLSEDVKFYGYEISPQAYDICKLKETENVRYFLQEIMENDEHYDLLLCVDVFEHIEDFFSFLRALSKKADKVIFKIPLDMSALKIMRDSISYLRESVGHIHYFSKETALATLNETGYKVHDYCYISKSVDTPTGTLRNIVSRRLMKILYKMNADFAARLHGGWSLLVLASAEQPDAK